MPPETLYLSEVLRDGLRLVQRREAGDAAKLKALRRAARTGWSTLDRGKFKEFVSADDLRAYLDSISEVVSNKSPTGVSP